MDLRWMAWTLPTALFFATIVLVLAIFTWLDLHSPSERRRGIFGVVTTRGDRLFLGLLGGGFLLAAWLAFTDATAIAGAFISAIWLAAALRWA
jgi:predicted small integral membrane protein